MKVYRSYGTPGQVTIHGHVFTLSPLPRRKHKQSWLINALAVVRLFGVRPVPGVRVRLRDFPDVQTRTDADGFFRIDWAPAEPLPTGWNTVTVEAATARRTLAVGEGQVLVPPSTRYGCISDIDDTFLISHSATIGKRLMVLLTQNAHSREPFAGVAEHYRLLAHAATHADAPNPFFFVSSSEWNLYDYILEFSRKNRLPEGVYLLGQLKRLTQLLKTGQGKHFSKLERIARILQAYPSRQFVLLGDDSQEDPTIYATVVQHHRAQIRCVYLRHVSTKKQHIARQRVADMEAQGVPCCYFTHSDEAIAHSRATGLIA